MPFDSNTPLKYFIGFCIQLFPTGYAALNTACATILTIGTTRILSAFADDIKTDINNLNWAIQMKHRKIELSKSVGQLIQFHVTVKELSFKNILNQFRANNNLTFCSNEMQLFVQTC